MVEGTINPVMNEPIVPSTRRMNLRWHYGGLEARQGTCMMKSAVLPISPYTWFSFHQCYRRYQQCEASLWDRARYLTVGLHQILRYIAIPCVADPFFRRARLRAPLLI